MPFTVTMPKLSPTMEEGVIAKWHKKEGDFVQPGDLLLEVATDKATVEYNALDEGYLRKVLVGDGKSAHVNEAIAIFTADQKESIEGYQPTGIKPTETPKEEKVEEKVVQPKKNAPQVTQQAEFTPEAPLENYQFQYPSETLEKRVKASPLAKKLAQEKGVDISSVKGSGPGSRVVSKDLELAQKSSHVAFGKREVPEIAPGTFDEVVLTPMRKVVGQRLQESKTYIPHFYVQQSIDAANLFSLREQLLNMDIKLTFNDFIIRAVALTLKNHPEINSGYNSVNQTLIRFKTIDISVAVSVEGGLITPIIRHADFKNLGEISVEVRSLATRAKEGKLEPHEYKGGSFTISNLGMHGVTDFQAIINPPQAAILAVSAIQDVPVVKNGTILPGKTLNLTLSVDHRVIDGVAAALFIKDLKKILENPSVLLI